MHRMLIASLAIGMALTSFGCAHRHRQHDHDHHARADHHDHHDGRSACYDKHHGHSDYKDYYDRHMRDRNRGGLGGRLEVNGASTRELDDLPGLSGKDAHRILENRPYASKHDLRDRHIITARQYDLIEDFIYVCRVCPERCDDAKRCVPCRDDDHHHDRRVMDRRG